MLRAPSVEFFTMFLELLGLEGAADASKDPCAAFVQQDFNDSGKHHASSEHF